MKTHEKIYSTAIFVSIIIAATLSGNEAKMVSGFIPVALMAMKILLPVAVVLAVVYLCVIVSSRKRR